MSENMREMTFEEEAVLYQQEARELFAKETPGYEAPPINHTVRRGMRIIRKAREEIEWLSGSCKNCTDQSNCCKNGNSWISVEDEKPKSRGHYFIAYKFAGSDMRFYGEAIWHDDIPDNGYVQGDHFSNEGVDGMYVTHWMEIPNLPKPPKEEV